IPTENQVHLTLPIYREKKGAVFFHQVDTTCALSQLFTPAGEVEPMPWRTLEVEVTPEWIKVFWEGEQITTTWGGKRADGCDPKKPLQWACTFMDTTNVLRKAGAPEPAVADAELALGDGLGLYIEQGVAAFRSVVIEPLSSQ